MKRRSSHTLLLFLSAALVAFSCRPASYEILKPGKNKKTNNSGDPNQVSPPDSRTEKPVAPPPITSNVPPTARVEVMVNGESVTRVHVGTPVQVRPSLDTVDPDDIGRSPCVNPGIVKADYDIAREEAKSAARSQGCEPLSVPHVFPREGRFEVTMIVTSNEDEKAVASMIVTVVKEGQPLTGADGGFTIAADPMLTPKNQDVTFTGKCETVKKNKITWDFGDGKTGEGVVVKHPYEAEGQYRVEATCTDEDGKSLKAVVTIVVIDKKVDIPGVTRPEQPTGPKPGDDGGDADVSDTDGTDAPDGNDTGDAGDGGTDSPDGGDGSDPGQKPGQVPGQRPGQIPGQKPGQYIPTLPF